MRVELEQRLAPWLAEAPHTDFPALERRPEVEVAVVGGGITGLTTALLLRRAGLSVAVLEARRVGCGVTGASTGKVTSLHGAKYHQIARTFGADAARTYAQANQAGLETLSALAAEFSAQGEDCCFERQPAYTFTCDPGRADEIRQEAQAAREAGLPAELVDDVPLPWNVSAAVRVDDQGQMDPYRYAVALANACARAGVEIFETSRVHDVKSNHGRQVCQLVGRDVQLEARHVVVATLLPFLDRGGFFARTAPSRSYGIAVTLDGAVPPGMHINIETPTRSLRPRPDGAGLIVVGEQHKVGQEPDTLRRYQELEAWTRERFPVRSVDFRWSSQDYLSADGLPYVGPMSRESGVLVATGFGKWGLSMGTAAAKLIEDLILGRDSPWFSLFDARRMDVAASARKLIEENANVAKRFVGDRLRSLNAPSVNDLGLDEGGIVKDGEERVAAYRNASGEIFTCSPVCTHMGCYLQWNQAERSWDCPCHGSRFDVHGDILQGPAVHALKRKRRS